VLSKALGPWCGRQADSGDVGPFLGAEPFFIELEPPVSFINQYDVGARERARSNVWMLATWTGLSGSVSSWRSVLLSDCSYQVPDGCDAGACSVSNQTCTLDDDPDYPHCICILRKRRTAYEQGLRMAGSAGLGARLVQRFLDSNHIEGPVQMCVSLLTGRFPTGHPSGNI
jgi:hypothetical protein